MSEARKCCDVKLGNIGDQQRSSYLIMCECGVHFQYSGSITSVKGGKERKSRVSYIKVTVCYKVQVDVQQSVPGVQC